MAVQTTEAKLNCRLNRWESLIRRKARLRCLTLRTAGRRLGKVLLAAALGGSSIPLAVACQARIIVRSEATCACQIRVDRIATLTDFSGEAGLSRPVVVSRSRGQYLVVPLQSQGSILLFDSRGQFVRQIGRVGRGPDEFRAILGIESGPADSVYIMDAGNGRVAVLAPSLVVARTSPMTIPAGWFGILKDGSLVALSAISRAGGARLHVYDPSMAPIRAFMTSREVVPVSSLRRRMTVTRDGIIAVSHWDDYEIEMWDASGRHLKTVVGETRWPEDSSSEGNAPPPPVQERPTIDGQGRLWTMIHVADTAWAEAVGPATDLYGRASRAVGDGDLDRYRDSRVEVIDPESGALLASLLVDPHLTFFGEDGLAWSYGEDELGLPFVDIWRLDLDSAGK